MRSRPGDTASQASDDDDFCPGAASICPSCRLAVNKDTGRLKWCPGGNDIWRKRIRFMLLIPAVILPVAIIIIAISKSTVIGKLSMTRAEQQAEKRVEPESVISFTTELPNDFIPTVQNDIEHSEITDRVLHPDVETSFLPPESLVALQNLQRLKRDMTQRDATTSKSSSSRRKRGTIEASKAQSTVGNLKSKLLQELQVNFSRYPRRIRGSDEVNSQSTEGGSLSESDDCDDEVSDDDEDDDGVGEESNEEEDEEEEEINEEEKIKKTNEALHWRTRSVAEPFEVNEKHENHENDDSMSYSVEDDDSLDLRTFWKGDWNKDFIRKAQAKMMLRYMDNTADPCQDFYQHSCGNWEKYNPIPDDKAAFDTFETLRESLDLVLKQLLEEPIAKDDSYEDSAVLKAKNLFQSCMNNEILEKRMERPLLELLDDLGGWPILRPDWDHRKFDWLLLVARLRLYSNDILISEWVGPDIKNSDEYIIQFDQTTLGLPTKDYFLESSNTMYLMAYKNYLITIATLLGASARTASNQAEELIQFEINLANITKSPNERRNSSELYKRMRLDELHKRIPNIDWHRYLSIVLERPVNISEPVVLFATEYLQSLVKLLSQTPPRVVANYLLWRFVRHRVNNLDDRFQEAKQTFYYILLGREKSPSRWKSCVTQVNWNMGIAVGSIFVKKYFDEMSKNDTLYMTQEIQRSFRELLNHSSWLDITTKYLASEKVEAMQLRIGYPNFILNPKDLDERFRDVPIRPDKYFENILNMLQHSTKIEHEKLSTPVNKTQWITAPAVVNAYYNRNKNQITFPAGILQPPFYHRYFPRSLNYGGIGVVIGHEITHGFDNKGRLFDKYGNYHRWWSEETVSEFEHRASCFINQYNRYTVKEVAMQVDGINTQGENIADNGGIKQAFRAYEKWLAQNKGADESLPGLNITDKQLFFLNFAQVWCGSIRPEAMRHKLKTDLHSPGKYRVIGTLSNFNEFAKTYNCVPGSPMNPIKKCLVW